MIGELPTKEEQRERARSRLKEYAVDLFEHAQAILDSTLDSTEPEYGYAIETFTVAIRLAAQIAAIHNIGEESEDENENEKQNCENSRMVAA
jgi:hypothetical protein